MVMVGSELDSGLQKNAGPTNLSFCKMQALGNDFVVVAENQLNSVISAIANSSKSTSSNNHDQLLKLEQEILPQIAKQLCSRHFGIGADGLIVVRRGSVPGRLSWTYLNSDGSVSLMCGNGLRCLALWAEQHGMAPGHNYLVETGIGPVEINFENSATITSDLGEPLLKPASIPVAEKSEQQIVAKSLSLSNETLNITCVGMGNPHCVIFLDELNADVLEKRAAELQSHSYFPEGVNVEFVKVDSRNHVTVIVYERGCGKTLACASGAAAVAVAGALENKTNRDVLVQLEGGQLHIYWDEKDNHVRITGPAAIVFKGSVDLKSLSLEALS